MGRETSNLLSVVYTSPAHEHFRGQPSALAAVRKVRDDPISGFSGNIAADEGGYILYANVPVCLEYNGEPLVLRCLQ